MTGFASKRLMVADRQADQPLHVTHNDLVEASYTLGYNDAVASLKHYIDALEQVAYNQCPCLKRNAEIEKLFGD